MLTGLTELRKTVELPGSWFIISGYKSQMEEMHEASVGKERVQLPCPLWAHLPPQNLHVFTSPEVLQTFLFLGIYRAFITIGMID